MVYRLQIVSIAPATPYLNISAVDQAVTTIGDWIRINGYTWLIWTQSNTMETSTLLQKLLSPKDVIVCLYANPKDAAGLAPEWLWNWINSRAVLHIPH